MATVWRNYQVDIHRKITSGTWHLLKLIWPPVSGLPNTNWFYLGTAELNSLTTVWLHIGLKFNLFVSRSSSDFENAVVYLMCSKEKSKCWDFTFMFRAVLRGTESRTLQPFFRLPSKDSTLFWMSERSIRCLIFTSLDLTYQIFRTRICLSSSITSPCALTQILMLSDIFRGYLLYVNCAQLYGPCCLLGRLRTQASTSYWPPTNAKKCSLPNAALVNRLQFESTDRLKKIYWKEGWSFDYKRQCIHL